jgi:AcrR family transcriptional regulator
MSEVRTADRLTAAALAILLAEGAQAVTMRRVAADAGVTTMATYRHYPNRGALLRAAVDAAVADQTKDWGTDDNEFDLRARTAVLLEHFLDFALGKPNLYAYLVTDRRDNALRFPDDFRGGGSPTFTPVLAAVEQGIREGLLPREDPVELTLTLVTPAMGLVQLYLGGRIGLPENEFRALCRRTTERVLNGLMA